MFIKKNDKIFLKDGRHDRQLEIEFLEQMNAIEDVPPAPKPLPMPKHTALSQARMVMEA